jgi:hypothetical protein
MLQKTWFRRRIKLQPHTSLLPFVPAQGDILHDTSTGATYMYSQRSWIRIS